MKFITAMLRNNNYIKWRDEANKSFKDIKKSLTQAPFMVIPNYLKDFLVFSFAFEDTVVAVLLPNKDEDYEQPITFFSKDLRDA